MKSQWQINMDFQNAKAQADKLDGIADSIEKHVSGQMRNAGNLLRSAWKGENASLYLQKEDRLAAQIQQTANDLRNIANDIRATARRIYDAEMTALRIATQRRTTG